MTDPLKEAREVQVGLKARVQAGESLVVLLTEADIALRTALDEVDRLTAERERLVKAHVKELRDLERSFQKESRDIAAERTWKERQGDEYGSY